jgi:hypothetical protein
MTVDEVRAIDPQYVDWISAQAWFRDKFPALLAVLVNGTQQQQSEETPAHNALQTLFLDNKYVEAALDMTYPGGVQATLDYNLKLVHDELVRAIDQLAPHATEYTTPESLMQESRDNKAARDALRKMYAQNVEKYGDEDAKETYRALVARDSDLWQESRDADKEKAMAVEARAAHDRYQAQIEWHRLGRISTFSDVRFEVHGVDVLVSSGQYSLTMIEVKPCVGDDYPAVFRQMMAAQQRVRGAKMVLFVDQFSASGATREQFVQMAARSNISVIFKKDVDERHYEIMGISGPE